MAKDDEIKNKNRILNEKLRQMVLTPGVMRWMNDTGLTEMGCRAILDYAQDQVQQAVIEQADPVMTAQSFIAAFCAVMEACGFAESEREDFLMFHYRLIRGPVKEQIEGFKPDTEGGLIISLPKPH